MSGLGSKPQPSRRSRDLRISIVAGFVVGLLIVLLGSYFAYTSSPTYTAESSIVVLPKPGLGPAQETSFYEYLSRGQIVATIAEVGNNAQFVQDAQDAIGMNEGYRAGSTVALNVVPSTSVVVAVATAPDPEVAVALANASVDLARKYLQDFEVPFRAKVVAQATSATPSGPSQSLILTATVVAALVAGFAAQQIVHTVLRSRSKRREASAAQEEPLSAGPSGA